MEERTCRVCKETFPLTKEFFYRKHQGKDGVNFYTDCKTCNNERRKYNLALTKARKEHAEKNKWMEELRGEKFTCKQCGMEKKFDEMKKYHQTKKVSSWCTACYRPKQRSYNEMSKANTFAKVLKEKRENQNRSE